VTLPCVGCDVPAGADITNATPEMAGPLLADQIVKLMDRLHVPNGLSALGYSSDTIPQLVEGALPQKRVTDLAPGGVGAEELAVLFEEGLTVY